MIRQAGDRPNDGPKSAPNKRPNGETDACGRLFISQRWLSGGRWLVSLVLLGWLCLAASFPALVAAQARPAEPARSTGAAPVDYERLPFMKHDDTAADTTAPSAGGLLLRTLGALLLVLSLLVAATWALRRWGGNAFNAQLNAETELAVVATLPLGERRTVSAVRFGDQLLLLGATPQSITLLAAQERPLRPVPPRMRSVAELLADEPLDEPAPAYGAAPRPRPSRGSADYGTFEQALHVAQQRPAPPRAATPNAATSNAAAASAEAQD